MGDLKKSNLIYLKSTKIVSMSVATQHFHPILWLGTLNRENIINIHY